MRPLLLALQRMRLLLTSNHGLVSLIQGEHVVNKQVLFALTEVGSWTPENRTGWALKKHGNPMGESFFLDIELLASGR
jgi:hypothetical protein